MPRTPKPAATTSPTRRSSAPRGSRTTTSRPTTTTTRTTTTEPRRFGLSLGGNLGDVRGAISAALAALCQRLGPLEVAPLYRTEAISPTPQDPYLNTVALGTSDLAPEALLAAALDVEAGLGRRRRFPGEPRTIDLDLLFVGRERRSGSGLELPHPRLRERRFVLAPLADLDPALELPPDGRTAGELLAELGDRPWVARLGAGSGG